MLKNRVQRSQYVYLEKSKSLNEQKTLKPNRNSEYTYFLETQK